MLPPDGKVCISKHGWSTLDESRFLTDLEPKGTDFKKSAFARKPLTGLNFVKLVLLEVMQYKRGKIVLIH